MAKNIRTILVEENALIAAKTLAKKLGDNIVIVVDGQIQKTPSCSDLEILQNAAKLMELERKSVIKITAPPELPEPYFFENNKPGRGKKAYNRNAYKK